MKILKRATSIIANLMRLVIDASETEQHRKRHTRTKAKMSFAQTDPSVVYVRQNGTVTSPDGQS